VLYPKHVGLVQHRVASCLYLAEVSNCDGMLHLNLGIFYEDL
jgi:hypothetical protein